MSGRRPIEEGKPNLVDWMWRLTERSELLSVLDERLKAKGGYADEEVESAAFGTVVCASRCKFEANNKASN